MRSLYIKPGLSPVGWAEPTPVAASPLLAELIGYLSGTLEADQGVHAEVLLADLLTPMPMTTIQVRLPVSAPARQLAQALRADPADRRTLRDEAARWRRATGRWRGPSRRRRACRSAAGGRSCG